MKTFLGLITPLVAYGIITLLHLIIPAKKNQGICERRSNGRIGQV